SDDQIYLDQIDEAHIFFANTTSRDVQFGFRLDYFSAWHLSCRIIQDSCSLDASSVGFFWPRVADQSIQVVFSC
ncbi:hypothetical protein E2562_000557, partial [Oryza meyeriana var. granulata]